MIRKLLTVSPILIATAGTLLPVAQERVKKKEAKDFPALMQAASAAWTGKHYGEAARALSDAQTLVTQKRREAVLKGFPAAPEGWTFKPAEVEDGAAMMMALTGMTVEGFYRGPESRRVSLTAMIDSPMNQMVAMMIQNPAMLGDDGELIKYGAHSAVLQKSGDKRYELNILIGSDIVKAEANGVSDDELLKLIDQATVDGLQAALKD